MKLKSRNHLLILIFLTITFLSSCRSLETTDEAVAHPEFRAASELPFSDLSSNHLPPPSLWFDRISAEDGLSNSIVTCILQDKMGYIWFGTQDGLNRYNGYDFLIFHHDPDDPGSLTDDFIESIYEDQDGILWVGTQDGLLEKFDPAGKKFFHYDIGARVLAIYEDSSGRFWVGTLEPGLMLFERETGASSLIWDQREINSIVEDQDGEIWVVSAEGGLGKYDEQSQQIIAIDIEYQINEAFVDSRGNLWLASLGSGLGLFDSDEQTIEFFQHDSLDPKSINTNNISTIYEGHSGDLWIGTYEFGLERFDPDTERFTHYQNDPGDPNSMSSNFVKSIFEDQSGVLWIGTGVGGGINKVTTDIERFGHYKNIPGIHNSLSGNLVTSVSSNQEGVIWIGTESGIDRWNPKTGEWRNYQNDPAIASSLSDNMVRSVFVDRTNNLWVGSEGGLDRYDRKYDRFIHYPDSPVVMWMHEGDSGRFWLATKGGLFELDRENDKLIFIKKGFGWKIMVYEDQDEIVWIGTSGSGLDRYNPITGDWQQFEHDSDDPSSLSNDFVESIHEDYTGTLWLGTGGGLNKFDRETQTFTHYREKDGAPHDYVNGILEDERGNLWLSTWGGLSKFNPKTDVFVNFDSSDGLQSNEFWRNAYHQTASGEMIFGGENGFNIFHPLGIVDNSNIPPVHIKQLRLFNQIYQTDLQSGDQVDLNYQENFLSLDFVALDYNNPENNQFAYRMDGVDDDWVMAGSRRHADYPNMKPGEYVFRLMGSNDDGIWNPTESTLYITIKPPFWGTVWFQGLIVFAMVGVVYGFFRLRVRNLEVRSHQLETQVQERTAALADANELLAQERAEVAVAEERTRLARELHDAVTQTLFSASLLAEALPISWENDPDEGRQLLGEIRQLSRGALAEMRTLLHELRPNTIAETGLSELLRQLAEAVAGREGIPVETRVDCQCNLPPDVHVALYRIAQESLNNIIKHARASDVSIQYKCTNCTSEIASLLTARRVTLTVKDDGRGFDMENIASEGMGLEIMRERADSVGADLQIISHPGKGTQIDLFWDNGE